MQLVEDQISQVQSKWPYVFFGLAVIAVSAWLLYLFSQLQTNQLQKRWYAMNILQVEKDTGIESNEETVNEALQGDITTKIRIPML